MEKIASILTPVEMLVVNLFIINKCSKKKHSTRTTYLISLFSIVLLLPAAYFLSSINPDMGNGNGFFVFASFIFIVPVKFLYRESVYKIISLACLSWVYTFIAFSLSVHIGELMTGISIQYAVFGTQTAIYALTLGKYYGLIQKKFLRVLAELSEDENQSLMWISVFWFWTVFVINLSYVYEHIGLIKVMAIASVAICALNFYKHVYHMLDSNRVILGLKDVAYTDNLTQLRGRALLENDVEELISRNLPFKLVFMDLDNFKSINDTYGHLIGDEYLSFFANEVKKRVGENGGFYRIAGDEFICLYTSQDVVRFTDSIASLPDKIADKDVPFLGVSYGMASFPDEADNLNELLSISDSRMYQLKLRKVGH